MIKDFLISLFLLGFFLFPSFTLSQTIRTEQIRIYRDSFGVAHIHAPTDAEAAYGFAWAQAEDDFETVQLTLLPIRGRMAEFSGKSGAIMDVAAAMIGVDTLVEQRYEQDLSPEFRKIVEAFAAAMTAYGKSHQDELLVKDLLPFTGKDIIKGYVFETAFLTGLQDPLQEVFANRLHPIEFAGPTGSNGFAFSPRRTADSLTYFCSNSHQPLQGPFSWYEAHIGSDEGWNMLGATFPGGITPFVGTNESLGWTHTVNHPDFVDIYQLEMHPTEKLTYRYDGKWLRLKEEEIKLKVKVFAGIKLPVKQRFYRSVYGLTIENDQGFFSIRFPANHTIQAAEQWYRMNKSSNWQEFHAALRMLGIPGTNIVYADKEGNIFYVGNALMPVRNPDFSWQGIVPGNTSATLWESFHDFSELPQVLNPACGWVFNSNHSPTYSTGPSDAPDSEPYGSSYLTIHNNRSLRFHEQLAELDKVSWEDFLRIKYDRHYSDSLYDPVVTNWKDLLRLDPEDFPKLGEALNILRTWDYNTDVESEGATLFLLSWHAMYKKLSAQGMWKYGFVASEEELAEALQEAVDHCEEYFGSIHVPLGEMQRHRRGTVDLPVGGGPEILAALYASEAEDGRFESQVGDGFILFAQYSPEGPVKIETMMPYGASARPGNPHFTDQMEMYVNQQRKPMTLDWGQIKAAAVEVYSPGK